MTGFVLSMRWTLTLKCECEQWVGGGGLFGDVTGRFEAPPQVEGVQPLQPDDRVRLLTARLQCDRA